MENKFNYCPNTTFILLKNQSSKFKVFLSMRRMHGKRFAGPKKLFHVSIYCTGPGVGHSNVALNLVVAHGLLHIAGKVRGCFVLVKKQ